jgi:hypothetical protein
MSGAARAKLRAAESATAECDRHQAAAIAALNHQGANSLGIYTDRLAVDAAIARAIAELQAARDTIAPERAAWPRASDYDAAEREAAEDEDTRQP